jgi:hypothetical protein
VQDENIPHIFFLFPVAKWFGGALVLTTGQNAWLNPGKVDIEMTTEW